jgi:hypothetical protein
MKFVDCELAILRHNVDNQKKNTSKVKASHPDIKRMLLIVEKFLRQKKLICYGGVSINAILPKEAQFYNYDLEIPDYDFFSFNALDDAKDLADLFVKHGFQEVEAKSGVHYGTYKVFVNFIGIADITYIDREIFNCLKKEAIKVDNLLYCPPNFLRMSMYLELSRPMGDISRWEKILKRLSLLNKYFPLKEISCFHQTFQRQLENDEKQQKIFQLCKSYLIQCGVVFFGSYAVLQYSQYMPVRLRKQVQKIPDFDVLSLDADKTAIGLKNLLQENGIENCVVVPQNSIGEIISSHFQVSVNSETIVNIYLPMACHSYNTIKMDKQTIKIATIETMMSFYLAFLYSSRKYYNRHRILCMAQYLFDVQQKNRLEQKGLLKRFTLDCYGKQTTMEDLRTQKTKKFRELRKQYGTRDYDNWFLRYRPNELVNYNSFGSTGSTSATAKPKP